MKQTPPKHTARPPIGIMLAQRQAGASMVMLVLVTLLVMLALILASLSLSRATLQSTSDQKDILRAQYAAESGLEYASANYDFADTSLFYMKPEKLNGGNPKYANFKKQIEKLCKNNVSESTWQEFFGMASKDSKDIDEINLKGKPYDRIQGRGYLFCYTKDNITKEDLSFFTDYLKVNPEQMGNFFKDSEAFGATKENYKKYIDKTLLNLFAADNPIDVKIAKDPGNSSSTEVINPAKLTAITMHTSSKLRLHYYVPDLFSIGQSENAERALKFKESNDNIDYYIEITAPGTQENKSSPLTHYAYYLENRGKENHGNHDNPIRPDDYFEGRVHTNEILKFQNWGSDTGIGPDNIRDSAIFNGEVTSAGCYSVDINAAVPTCEGWYRTGKYYGGVIAGNEYSFNSASKVHNFKEYIDSNNYDKASYVANHIEPKAYGDKLNLDYSRQLFGPGGVNLKNPIRSIRIGWKRHFDGSITKAPLGKFSQTDDPKFNPLRKIPRKAPNDYKNASKLGIRISQDVDKLQLYKDENDGLQVFDITIDGKETKLGMDKEGKMWICKENAICNGSGDWQMAKRNPEKEPINWEVTTSKSSQATSVNEATILYVDGTIKSLFGPERTAGNKINDQPAIASFANIGIVARQNIVITGDIKYEKKICDLSTGSNNNDTACETTDGQYSSTQKNWLPKLKYQNMLGITALGFKKIGKDKYEKVDKSVDDVAAGGKEPIATEQAGIALGNSCNYKYNGVNYVIQQNTDPEHPSVPVDVEIDAFLYAPNGSFGFENTQACGNTTVYAGDVKVRGGTVINSVGVFRDSGINAGQSYIYDLRGEYYSPIGFNGMDSSGDPEWLDQELFSIAMMAFNNKDSNPIVNGYAVQASMEDIE